MAWHPPKTIRGYEFGEVASALQKSIRRGWEDEALYWAAELDRSGYAKYCWYRLLVILSEDIGLAEPGLPATIGSLHSIWSELHKKKKASAPERLYLVQAVLHLVRARKSRIVDDALWVHFGTDDRLYEIPDVALDSHTARGRRMGRGEAFWWAEAHVVENEHPDLPNPYTDRAKALAPSSFKAADATSAKADSELAFEALDEALSVFDATATLRD